MPEIVTLRLVDPKTKLSEAIDIAVEAKQSAIVVDGPKPYVLHVREMLPVLREKKDIQVGKVQPFSRSGQKSEKYRDLHISDWSEQGLEVSVFGVGTTAAPRAPSPETGVDFTILSVGRAATVETAHEPYANIIRGPITVCTCSLDNTHKWEPDELSNKDLCEYDRAPLNCK
jgi:hypothetical protein